MSERDRRLAEIEGFAVATEFNTPKAETVGRLVSRLMHPIFVDYGDEKLRVGSRSFTPSTIVFGKLGKLPAGIVFVAG